MSELHSAGIFVDRQTFKYFLQKICAQKLGKNPEDLVGQSVEKIIKESSALGDNIPEFPSYIKQYFSETFTEYVPVNESAQVTGAQPSEPKLPQPGSPPAGPHA